MRRGDGDIFRRDRSVHPPTNQKIFKFKTDAGLQFNTEYKFSFSRSSLFSPLSGHSKPIKPMKLLSFLPIW